MIIKEHAEFTKWISKQTITVKMIISTRLLRVADGNFGDAKSVGDGVSELRIQYGAGFRIYYTIRGREIVLLLCGGDKSGQKRDIKKAKKLNKEV